MDINKFSERLSHCMQEHHLNGNDLAALSGVTAATISRYLNGLRTPTVDNVVLLADALDVSVDYLLGRHNVPDDKCSCPCIPSLPATISVSYGRS